MLATLGTRTHIVHFLYDLEADADPRLRAQQLFAESADEIVLALQKHFGLEHGFEVRFELKRMKLRSTVKAMNPAQQFERALFAYSEAGEQDWTTVTQSVMEMMDRMRSTSKATQVTPAVATTAGEVELVYSA